jgi:anti-anti-sigma factor
VRSEEKNGTARLWLSGEFDIAGIPLFAEELDRLQRHGRDVAVLDLAQLVFIDALSLQAVLAVGQAGSNGRPRPALVGACPAVSRIFEAAGLEHHLADRQ